MKMAQTDNIIIYMHEAVKLVEQCFSIPGKADQPLFIQLLLLCLFKYLLHYYYFHNM